MPDPKPEAARADAPEGVGAGGNPTSKPGNRKAKWFRHLSASSLGIEIALTIVLGWWGGRWLERNWTHWSPWTTYIGFFVGCGASVLAIRRTIREYKLYLAELDADAAPKTERGAELGIDSESRKDDHGASGL